MSLKIHPKIEQINTKFNGINIALYFIKGERNIIIDTGTNQSPQRDILPRLKALGLDLSDIDLILNTHGHFDHIGGDAAIKTASGAEVFIHKNDADFLHEHESCFESYFAPVIKLIGGSIEAEKKAIFGMLGPDVVPDRQLKDGDVIDGGSGMELEVVHLPGHTLGSVAFFWEREGILFSGDSVVGLHVAGAKLPVVFNLSEYMKSLKRVKEMPIRFLLCAHDYRGLRLPPSPVRQGKEVSQYLQDSQECAEELDAAIRQVISSGCKGGLMQIADEVIARIPKEMGFKPITQVQMPLPGAQTVFFRFCQLRHQDVLE